MLGISWNLSLDVFQFDVLLPPSVPKTKRSILSLVAKIFDPLGWIAPVTIKAKVFLQQLWQAKVDWDEAIADKLLAQWETIQASLATISGLHVDRWVKYGSDTANCELHGFCDASTTAFAAAVYIRVTSLAGETTSRLLVAKSKVAPIKSLSIPRLELSAVLLARLLEFVRSSLQLTAIPCFCWTDARVVLAWVTQHPLKWKTFVSNRVSEIQSRIPFAAWRHVPTEDNPADCASRGILGCHLASHHLWWQGPSWLRLPKNEWPAQRKPSFHDSTLEQNSRINTHIAKPIERWDLMVHYSSWPKLIRVTAYILRFINRTRRIVANVSEASPLVLSAEECRSARNFWLRRIQEEDFPVEQEVLLSQMSISSKSAIMSLNPFIGEDKLIRVGGRLANAPLPLTAKHPIILSSHPLVSLLVQHAHIRSLHAGTQLTLATLRRAPGFLDLARAKPRKGRNPQMRNMRPRKGGNSHSDHGAAASRESLPSRAYVSTLRAGLCRSDACSLDVRSWDLIA